MTSIICLFANCLFFFHFCFFFIPFLWLSLTKDKGTEVPLVPNNFSVILSRIFSLEANGFQDVSKYLVWKILVDF